MNYWQIFCYVALACLILSFFIGKNAIWAGFALGIYIAVPWVVVNLIRGLAFNLQLVIHILTVTILLGALFELIGRTSKTLLNK